MTPPKSNKAILSRREALKTLAAITGAVALSNLPNQWEKPVVDVGVLPAHAQTSHNRATQAQTSQGPSQN